ncbi:hypothetical protein [Verrucosispora sp. WMMC514]|uniref:hypothetical protein n=1 Tax=Verrucosispora sp. WMMC514 TaxID=3015156 RepID=UPI00248BC7E5|nr:hypothetical protein [Verrucosispora sp. WMMC514]WBB94155.1 hypothetical protein O7597_15000 [Verrucosispora sp. WMMC514]
MTTSDRDRWVQRLRDAAIEATCLGADRDELDEALTEGVEEGLRLLALRSGTAAPAPRLPQPREATTGGALARLTAATAGIQPTAR